MDEYNGNFGISFCAVLWWEIAISWSRIARNLGTNICDSVRIHELFIALMLIFGTLARLKAISFKRPLEKISEHITQRKAHKKWGKIALISTGCGWLTAGILLFGMFGRA